MSKNDVKKGIAIQAKADAEKVEKFASGLRAHKEMLESLELGQGEIREAMGEVLDDMSSGEAKMLYDLTIKKTPEELDETEKRVLCASIYTLISRLDQPSENQRLFYSNIEQYMGISERKDDFDFMLLNNLESHTDRLVILKAICSFLFLGSNSFEFLRNKEEYAWMFAFASVKDISDVCGAINSEFAVLGAQGVLGNYSPLLSMRGANQQDYYRIRAEIQEDDESETEEFEDDNYSELTAIINSYMSDEGSFGVGAGFDEKELKLTVPREYERVAFDSLIAASKIEKGRLFFTTYAMYIRTGFGLKFRYVCLPYSKILYDKMSTTAGKAKGTVRLCIPYLEGEEEKQCYIEDNKINEEKLRELLNVIHKSNCRFAETDREIMVSELEVESCKKLLACYEFAMKEENLPLGDVFLEAVLLDLKEAWDEIVELVKNEEDYKEAIKSIIDSVPYPSKRAISITLVKLLMNLVAHGNVITGKQATLLTSKMENMIREFDVSSLPSPEFNALMKDALSYMKEKSIEEYSLLKDFAQSENIAELESVLEGLDLTIKRIESSFSYKAAQYAKKGAKGIGEGLGSLLDLAQNSPLADKLSGLQKKPEHNIISVDKGNIRFLLPDGYEEVKKRDQKKVLNEIFNIAGTGYSKTVENSSNVILVFNTTKDSAMDCDDIQRLIDGIHESLAENQGLIEARSGETKRGYKYIYSIVKTLQEDTFGVQYFLRMNLMHEKDIVEIRGFFTEIGTTGLRESMCACFAQNVGIAVFGENDLEGWTEDPYDENYTKGALMNLAEREGLDGLFPGNPLTQARELVLAIVNDELAIIKSDNDGVASDDEHVESADEEKSEEKDGNQIMKELFDKNCGCRRHTIEVKIE